MTMGNESAKECLCYPLTCYQEDIWLNQSIYGQGSIYNIGYAVEFREFVDYDVLKKAIDYLIMKNDALRIKVISEHNRVYQQIVEDIDAGLMFIDASKRNHPYQYCIDWMKNEILVLFENNSVLFKFVLIKIANNHYYLFCKVHHLIADGWSLGMIQKDIIAAYYKILESGNEQVEKKKRKYVYTDFVLENIKYVNSEEYKEDIDFWRKKYSEIAEPIFNVDFKYDAVRDILKVKNKILVIKREHYNQMSEFGKQEGFSIFQILMGILAVQLSRFCQREELVIGSVLHNRMKARHRKIIGQFANEIPLKMNVKGDLTFIELLNSIQNELNECINYMKVPLGEIYRTVNGDKVDKKALFDVSMNYMNILGFTDSGKDKKLYEFLIKQNKELFYNVNNQKALAINIIECGAEEDVQIHFNYHQDVFAKGVSIDNLVLNFEHLLNEMITNSNKLISEIEIVNPQEMSQLLYDFNNTQATYPSEKTIHQLFEEQVIRTPDNIAAVFNHDRVTYKELNKKANKLARVLRTKGVQADSIVAIMMERSVEMIVGMLGILKAGGAYLPIDPGYPDDRIEYILEDSDASVLLTTCDICEKVKVDNEIICIDDERLLGESECNLEHINTPSDRAYIIYTSGTTGRPKGVMIEHQNVVRLMVNDNMQFDFSEDDVWTMFHSFCFDFSVWEMYGALLYGGKLVVVAKLTAQNPKEYLELLSEEKVTVLNQTPTAFYNLMEQELKSAKSQLKIRYVIFGGEALKPMKLKDWKKKYPHTKLINMYGITETTVHVTYKEITYDEIESNISNIGKPIPTLTTYVMDKNSKLMPIGAAGELCVGGLGVGRGYLNREELTMQKFVKNPYRPSERLYRSGDLVRILSSGDLEYLGRIDQQVKIRGFRIELGEIEAQLLKYSGIREAVVVAREEEQRNKYLCAYIVTDINVKVSKLKADLSKVLPEYMIPAYFINLERMPLTSNGKIDVKALPQSLGDSVIEEDYVAPVNNIESTLVQIWGEVLEFKQVGITQNFFVLGGDSIKAITLISKMNNELEANVQLKDLYAHPTVLEMSELILKGIGESFEGYLQKGLSAIERMKQVLYQSKMSGALIEENIEDFYPLSKIQLGMVFNSKLNREQPVYHDLFIYNIKKDDFDFEIYQKAVALLVEKHAMLRTVFDIEAYSQPIQIVYKNICPQITIEDIIGLGDAQQERIKKYVENDLKNKYKFDRDLLWRMKLFKVAETNYYMILSFHHAILDGWSLSSFNSELQEVYERLLLGEDVRLSPLKTTYKDYVAIMLGNYEDESVRAFWCEYLENYVRNKLPFNMSGKKISNSTGMGKVLKSLGATLMEKLEEQAITYKCTLKDICLSAYVYLLSIITTEKDIVTGVVTHERPTIEDGEKMLGCFLNTVPFRMKVEGIVDGKDLLNGVIKNLNKIKANEIFLGDIADAIGETDRSGNPIFDTIYNFTNFHVLKDKQSRPILVEGQDKFNLKSSEMTNTLFDMEVSKMFDGLMVWIKYSQDYFSCKDAETALNLYIRILEQFADGNWKLCVDDLMPIEQKNKLLYKFNDTEVEFPEKQTMHGLFEQQAEKTPHNIALVFEGKEMTYGELNEKSNQLAWALLEKDFKSGDNVGLIVKRSFEMVMGMLAILKAGGTYVPIDPDYPQERKEYLIKNSSINIAIVDGNAETCCREYLEINFAELTAFPTENLNLYKDSRDLAYVIYTSGSTGQPKGVMIEHRSAVNLITWVNKRFKVCKNDTLLFITSMCFDLSVYDIFGILAAGGKIVIVRKEEVQSPEQLKKLMCDEKITFWDSVPTTMNYLIDVLEEADRDYYQDKLRLVFLSGDWIPVKLPQKINKYFPKAEVISLGGATEGTIWSIYYPIKHVSKYQTSIPYGIPLDNNYFYILDENRRVVPEGVAGELYIGGVGVARGYMNDQERTQKSFVHNRFLESPNEMMYKTGDLGRFLPDGNIEFLGRKDHQVKIRGYRVELGEVENQLLKHNDIKEVVLTDKADGKGVKYLCAYVVSDKKMIFSEVKTYLSKKLPYYMIPSYFIQMDKIPLTSNGKINRKALPAPEAKSEVSYVAPRNNVEKTMVEVWGEILKIDHIGINDNLFDLGGNSLSLIRAIPKLSKKGLRIDINSVFEHPTIAELVNFVEEVTDYSIENQEIITGEVPYLPNLAVLDRRKNDIQHWNISIILEVYPMPTAEVIKQNVRLLLMQHDGLRLRLYKRGSTWMQYIEELGEALPVTTVDFSHIPEYLQKEHIEEMAAKLQAEINLEKQPFNVIAFYLGENKPGRFMILVHHAISDGYSFMILLQDFLNTHIQIMKNEKVVLPQKSTSIKRWAEHLNEYAQRQELKNELSYWKNIPEIMQRIPVDYTVNIEENNLFKYERQISDYLLTKEETKYLFENILSQKIKINDVLVTALAMTVNRWYNTNELLVGYTLNGRYPLDRTIDLSRTIGWLAFMVPVYINFQGAKDDKSLFDVVKENLTRIPNGGLGYGCLRYLCNDEKISEEMSKIPHPEITFNYFEDVDVDRSKAYFYQSETSYIKEAQEYAGDNEGTNIYRGRLVDFVVEHKDNRLFIRIHYSNKIHNIQTIQQLEASYRENLMTLLNYLKE